MVSELPDGRMILSDCFIRDRQEDVYKRPTVNDDVSRTPQHYQLIPWEHTKTGDFLKHIDPVVTVRGLPHVAQQPLYVVLCATLIKGCGQRLTR